MIGSEEVKVDSASIEKSLAELWRGEKDGERAVTRAALWNVVAHTWDWRQQTLASEMLARVSEAVPQRTIVIRATPSGDDDIASWISANCHMLGKDKQVCSEEIAIVAGGRRVKHVPPLVSALLIPDMPVAFWWVGDLPDAHHDYVETLLEPADRLIVDSSSFNTPTDLDLVLRIAEQTTTALADLNWVRLEEWRAATASIFDPPAMREQLRRIASVHVIAPGMDASFGEKVEGMLYAGWLGTQTGREIACSIEHGSPAGIASIELRMEDGSRATIARDRERGVLISNAAGAHRELDCITRVLSRGTDDLIVRQLKRPEADRIYVRALRAATRIAHERP